MKTNPIKDFSYVKKINYVKAILNIILSFTLIILINVISANYYGRIDLTKNGDFSLSAETKAYLRNIDQETLITVILPTDTNDFDLIKLQSHLKRLLKSYELESRNNKKSILKINYIDPYREKSEANMIFNKYKIKGENIVLISQGNKFQIVRDKDLVTLDKNNDISGYKSEEAITAALIKVNAEKSETIYFLTGHGEMDINDNDPYNGLSSLRNFLESRNYIIKRLNLLKEQDIPNDASLVIIASPQGKINPLEVNILRKFTREQNGKIISLIDPGRIHGLDDLFYDWGIIADNHFIYEPSNRIISSNDNFIISKFAKHPINHFHLDYKLNAIFGPSRPVKIDPLSFENQRLSVKEIIGTSEDSWIEKNYLTESAPKFNKNEDIKGPISIASVSTLINTSSLGINIPSGRVAVFGNSKFIANDNFEIFGNQILFHNTINWILHQIEFLNIPSRPNKKYRINVSQDESNSLIFYFTIIPSTIGLWGFLILYFRKR